MTGPGTAPSGRPRADCVTRGVERPERRPASSTTVASLAAAISRLRCRNLHFVGAVPHGSSEMTAPWLDAMRVSSDSWPIG